MKLTYHILSIVLLISMGSCKKGLEIAPPSELSDEFLATKKGAVALLNGVYANGQFIADPGANRIYVEEATTDNLVNYRGILNIDLLPFQNFNWLPTTPFISQFYNKNFTTIRDANILLNSLSSNSELSDTEKKLITAEARFLRGLAYFYLYNWFGPVPLNTQPFTSPNDNFSTPKVAEPELLTFIETELTAAATDLPGTIQVTGKASKGAALGVLAKFYLQTRNWAKAAEAAKQVMELGLYQLQPDYSALFAKANKGNTEMVFVYPAIGRINFGNVWTANALPPQYPTTVFNTATQVCIPLAFYNTFGANDKRKNLILTSYTSTTGASINLLTGVEYQNPRSLKYPIDPQADDRHHANDFP
ncbi:MAG: RagB/SusD family nutrient uptake outer membrane protein, partial [Flavitalea sp.]